MLMKRFLLLILAALALCSACTDKDKEGPKAGHVIFIGVDGVSTPAFKDPKLLDGLPNLKMMMNEGSYTLEKRSVMPSASAINWASIFNGLPTEQHGFGHWNTVKPEIPPVLDNGRGMPPTIYTLLREQRPDAETGCVYDWDGIGPLILYGKHVRKGYVLDEPVMQYDLPATLCYALGLKIPPAWRGRPLTSMFE